MQSGNEHESEQPLSPEVDRALGGLRGEFRATQARGVDAAMRRVRQEAELRARMGATVRARETGRSWAVYQRVGLAAAAFAIVTLAGFAGMERFARSTEEAVPAVSVPPMAARPTMTEPTTTESAAPLVERIAAAQPGDTVVLAQRATIQAVDKPLRFAKKVRVEVATYSN